MLQAATCRAAWTLLAALLFAALAFARACRADFGALTVSGYADFRLIAPPRETAWLNGGLGQIPLWR